MDIQTADNKFQNITFGDSSFDELKEELSRTTDQQQHHLGLFLGSYLPDKEKALEEFSSALNRKIHTINTQELVSKIESQTFTKLDTLFDGLDRSDEILYFKNGGKLCGTYTGYSHSHVKYATPQERYFLNKVKAFKGLVVVDIDELSDADKTLRRAAHSIVTFYLPDSKLQRFMWHLKNFSAHGFELKTKRPEAYGEAS